MLLNFEERFWVVNQLGALESSADIISETNWLIEELIPSKEESIVSGLNLVLGDSGLMWDKDVEKLAIPKLKVTISKKLINRIELYVLSKDRTQFDLLMLGKINAELDVQSK
jgi:hypothetical protein